MSDRVKNIAVTIVFLAALIVVSIANMAKPLSDISYAERRKLKQPPDFTLGTVLDGSAFSLTDAFLTDQFILRETFRRIKSLAVYYVYARSDNNGIAIIDGNAIKIESSLRESSVTNAASKFSLIASTYFPESKCYFALIPEQNHYLASQNGYPALDYSEMARILNENLEGIAFLDLSGALGAEDYYATDPHWRQERLESVLAALSEHMSFAPASIADYSPTSIGGFYGAFYGQSALPLSPDTIVYLESEATSSAIVFNYEKNQNTPVYSPELFLGVDPYDLFLSGASPLITIENALAKTDRALVIFRDSFGSSIAPLLIESYKTITLVDLRYMSSSLVDQYISDTGGDVLFLYCSSVIANSEMLK